LVRAVYFVLVHIRTCLLCNDTVRTDCPRRVRYIVVRGRARASSNAVAFPRPTSHATAWYARARRNNHLCLRTFVVGVSRTDDNNGRSGSPASGRPYEFTGRALYVVVRVHVRETRPGNLLNYRRPSENNPRAFV